MQVDIRGEEEGGGGNKGSECGGDEGGREGCSADHCETHPSRTC